MNITESLPIDAGLLRVVALESGKHEQTVARVLRGELAVRPSSRTQVLAALARLGLDVRAAVSAPDGA